MLYSSNLVLGSFTFGIIIFLLNAGSFFFFFFSFSADFSLNNQREHKVLVRGNSLPLPSPSLLGPLPSLFLPPLSLSSFPPSLCSFVSLFLPLFLCSAHFPAGTPTLNKEISSSLPGSLSHVYRP